MRKVILFFSLLFCATSLFANTINSVVFFGDSLTDNGNLHRYLPIMPKSPPYYEGRFSNGPLWSDYLMVNLNKKFNLPSANYAVGGATAKFQNPFKGALPLKISEEILDYHMRTLLTRDRSHILFIIWIGANDYMADTTDSPESMTNQVVGETNVSISTLIGYGAKNFLVLDLPDLSLTPRGSHSDQNTIIRYKNISLLHHMKMKTMVASIQRAHPDFFVGYVDVYSLMTDIITSPQKYNQQYHTRVQNVTDSCWTGGYTLARNQLGAQQTLLGEVTDEMAHNKLSQTTNPQAVSDYIAQSPSLQIAYEVGRLQGLGLSPCQDPDSYLFWDSIHPTRATHQILGGIVEDYLQSQNLRFPAR